MAVRYTIPFKDYANLQWRVDISDSTTASGTPIPIRGNGTAATIAWVPDTTDDPFSVYKSSTLTLNVIQEGQINIDELQDAQDTDFLVRVFRNDSLYWQGFLVPEGIQYPLLSNPVNFTFTAICGLTMLADIPYSNVDLEGTTIAISRCPMNYFRNILFTLLGNIAPIRWTNLLVNPAFDLEDVFVGPVQWGADGEAFFTYLSGQISGDVSVPQTCDYILKGMLQAMQCFICFDNGAWHIRRIPDINRSVIPYNQIAGDLDMMVVNTATENITKQIGRYGFPFIKEDAIITVRQGVKSCTVTYAANVRDNILPNGDFDQVSFIGLISNPTYWGIYDPTDPFVPTDVSLDGRAGFCASLVYEGLLGADQWFTMFNGTGYALGKHGLPLDTVTMIPHIVFGFTFEADSGGWPLNEDGTINWTTNPFQIKVIYNAGGTQYFLNQFGFWTTVDTFISIIIDGLSLTDVGQVDFNKFQNIIIPLPPGDVVAGYECDIQVLFRVAEGQDYKLDNVYFTIDSGNEVYSSSYDSSKNTTADTRSLNISSAFGGYNLSNFMTSPFNSGDECYFKDGAIYEGSLTGLTANSIMRCCYKSNRIFNGSINTRNQKWVFDSTYNIDGFGSKLFMPLAASYNIEQCEVNNLIAIEIRNDNVTFTETFYNSNTVTNG
jgi:hypothetical protein